MKQLLGASLAILLMSSCNFLVNNETSRKEFVDGCKKEFVQMGLVVEDSLVDDYCACSADKILSKFDIIDLIKMNDTTSQVYRESQELIKPCLDAFKAQLEEPEF